MRRNSSWQVTSRAQRVRGRRLPLLSLSKAWRTCPPTSGPVEAGEIGEPGEWSATEVDFVMGTDRRLFTNVAVRNSRHNNDHYMVLGCLRSASLRENRRYLGVWRHFLLKAPAKKDMTEVDKTFSGLKGAMPRPDLRQNAWISKETWALVESHVTIRQEGGSQAELRRVGRHVNARIQADRTARA